MSTVMVVGPALAGAGAVAAALRQRLSGCDVVEGTDQSGGRPPDVVVFVVSAAAPMANCDAALLDVASQRTDAVVAAVTKIDVHRTWRAVLQSNRSALGRYAPRYRTTPWVGVAAEPQVGRPVIEPLVAAVRAVLGDVRRERRNRLRIAEDGLRRRIAAQQDRVAGRQAAAADRTALRIHIRRTRLDLAARARACTAALRAELQQCAAGASRRDVDRFADHVRRRVAQTGGEFDDVLRDRIAEVFGRAGLPGPDAAPMPLVPDCFPSPRRPAADDTLTVVFASAFGLGVALTLSRLVSDVVGGTSAWVLVGCGVAGAVLTAWVVRTRRLIAARLVLDRWAGEVSAVLRTSLEERVLAAETSLLAAHAAAADQVRGAGGRAEEPTLRQLREGLARVRAELGDTAAPNPRITGPAVGHTPN